MEREKVTSVCITHKGDLDGLASAALASRVWKAKVVPVGYDDMLENIESERSSRLILTDLGLSEKTFAEFVASLKKFDEVIIVDHHPLSNEHRMALRQIGVKLVHDIEDCTTVLAYDHWKSYLPFGAARLAAYAALTDYMENGPIARRILERFERITLFHEATLYALALIWRENSREGLLEIVSELKAFRRPYESEMVVSDALQAAHRISRLREYVTAHLKRMDNVAVVETVDDATGTVATLALEIEDFPVAIAYKTKGDLVKISSRSLPSFQAHLGKLVAELADSLGGVGGGHRHATGARIPTRNLEKFLRLMVAKLSK